jgi:hypothetical protein
MDHVLAPSIWTDIRSEPWYSCWWSLPWEHKQLHKPWKVMSEWYWTDEHAWARQRTEFPSEGNWSVLNYSLNQSAFPHRILFSFACFRPSTKVALSYPVQARFEIGYLLNKHCGISFFRAAETESVIHQCPIISGPTPVFALEWLESALSFHNRDVDPGMIKFSQSWLFMPFMDGTDDSQRANRRSATKWNCSAHWPNPDVSNSYRDVV